MLTVASLNNDAFVYAVKKLREQYGNKEASFFETCKNRLFDVMYVGKNKKQKQVFHIYKNEKLGDKYNQRFRVVVLSGLWRWCTCFMSKFGQARYTRICTHVGAALLYRWYFDYLNQEMPIEKDFAVLKFETVSEELEENVEENIE